MAQLGNTVNPPNGGAFYFVTSGKNQYAQQFTMPSPGGNITDASAYFDLYSGSGTCYVCLWDSGGNLLASASVGSVGAGTQSVDGQHWHSGTFAGNGIYVAGGASVWLGIWTPGNCLWTTESSGTCASDAQSSGPGSFATHSAEQGNGFPVYANYTPLAAPTLSNVSPAVAPAGQTVTLTGTGLLHTTGITVCGVNAPTYTINSDTSITVTVPAGAAGAGNIVVTTPAGTASIAFTAGGIMWVNTGTPASPVWTAAPVFVQTGTPASPVWTQAIVYVNQGTPASPNWVVTS